LHWTISDLPRQPADRDKYPAVRIAQQWQPGHKRAAAAIGSLTIPVVSLQLCRIKLRSKELRNRVSFMMPGHVRLGALQKWSGFAVEGIGGFQSALG
jgi:hypothetical protein